MTSKRFSPGNIKSSFRLCSRQEFRWDQLLFNGHISRTEKNTHSRRGKSECCMFANVKVNTLFKDFWLSMFLNNIYRIRVQNKWARHKVSIKWHVNCLLKSLSVELNKNIDYQNIKHADDVIFRIKGPRWLTLHNGKDACSLTMVGCFYEGFRPTSFSTSRTNSGLIALIMH